MNSAVGSIASDYIPRLVVAATQNHFRGSDFSFPWYDKASFCHMAINYVTRYSLITLVCNRLHHTV